MFLVSSCTSNVRTTVSTFRSLDALPSNATIKVLPRDVAEGQYFDELEFDYFRQKLAQKFVEKGYRLAAENESATLVAYLQYDTQRQEKNRRPTSTFLHSSYGLRYGYGSFVVLEREERERFEYLRRVKVSVFSNTEVEATEVDTKALLSISAESSGRCQHLVSVYDDILTAIFQNPMRENGSVIKVPVRATRKCAGR